MGLVLQFQRSAIEDLHKFTESRSLPQSIASMNLIMEDGTPFFILGISIGVGTCSDIQDMDVLVLGCNPPKNGPIMPRGATTENCSYAILLRFQTEREFQEMRKDPCHEHEKGPRLCVELLRIKMIDNVTVVLSLTGKVVHYPSL